MIKFSPQLLRARVGRWSAVLRAPASLMLFAWAIAFGSLHAQDIRSAGDRGTVPAAAGTVTVSGRVVDGETKEPLIGVTVSVVGRVAGTITDGNGGYRITVTNAEAGLKLRFSYVGYESQDIALPAAGGTLNVTLAPVGVMGKEVVVSASRVAESVLEAPVSVERLDAIAIRETPSVNFYDAIANLKAVDMTTTSLGFKTVNARGFNSPGNTRFVQLIDGMDNQAPGLNFSVGNIVGVTDLDVASAELIPGAASALYGPNALNGILVMQTKDPFAYQGASARVQFGVNHVDNFARDIAPYLDAAIRYAKAFNDKFAFKLNISYMAGQDWHASSQANVAAVPNIVNGQITNLDRLNFYGDEATATLPGIGVVSRTPYAEKDLVDYGVNSLRGNAQLNYRFTDKLEASLFYSYGQGTTVYQGANRYSLRNFTFQQLKAEIKGDEFFLRGYMTIENSGDSYDSRFLALNLNRVGIRSFNPATGGDIAIVPETQADATWFQRYGYAFSPTGAAVLGIPAANDLFARSFADRGRLVPGSENYTGEFNRIRGLTDFRRGAKFNDQTRMYHAEGQYNFKKLLRDVSFAENLEVLVGGNFRLYELRSNGTIFPDTVGNAITIYEYGGFASASYKFFEGKLKVSASARYDKNQNFDARFTPRISAVYEVMENHFLRASFTTGFRMPTTQEQFIDLNLGAIRLLGGLETITRPYDLTGNIWTLESVNRFSATVNQQIAAAVVANGGNPISTGQQAAIALANASVLQVFTPQRIRPEYTETYEVGYKGLLDNKLFWDVNYYYTRYYDFLGFQRVVRPGTEISGPNGSLAPLDLSGGNFQVYQLYVPAQGSVFSQGFTAGLEYAFFKGYRINANYTFAELNLDSPDPTFTAFNTPKHKTNLSFYNRNVARNVGFNVTWRWSDTYRWQASFGDGQVPAFNLVDAQISFRVPDIKTVIKFGGSNILNNRHFEIWGGPMVGAIYYVSFNFDEAFSN